MQIYTVRDGEQFGPYTDEEVRDYLAQGALLRTDLAWHLGLENWVALGEVELQCPPERTAPPPSRLAPKIAGAQSLSPWTGLGSPEGPFADSSLLNGFIIIPANLNGELTREIAAELLNQQLAAPRITQLTFERDGIERAKADGLIREGRDFELFGSHDFEQDRTSFLHRLSGETDQIRRPEDDKSGTAQTPFFELTTPLPARVEKMTGITSGPLGSRILQAEYISAYVFPRDMQAILPYIYTGQRNKAAFQRYDDGWRIVGEI
jgi:hypothetical protein